MTPNKTVRQNRLREALGRLYDQQPPYFREYLRRFQEDPTSRVFAPLAEAYRRMGRIEEAIEICREGLDHHPDFHGGRVALAKCLIDKRDLREAKAQLDRVVGTVPENLLAQRLLGEVALALGDREAALHAFKMALLLAPSDVPLAEQVHRLEKDWLEGAPKPRLSRDDAASLIEEPEEHSSLDAALGEGGGTGEPSLWEVDASVALTPAPRGDLRSALGQGRLEELEEEEGPPPEESTLEELLGDVTGEEDGFQAEHVSEVFKTEEELGESAEITTETLGDLYFSQGQYEKALRIFEKLPLGRDPSELTKKMDACRRRLGVSREGLVRRRQILVLQRILDRLHQG